MLSKVEAISITQTQSLSSRRPRLSTDHIPSTDVPPSSYVSSPAKSISRSQSRPISSTTTATHSTIAPLPSDSFRRRMNGRHEYAPQPGIPDDTHELDQNHDQRSDCHEHEGQYHPPRSETPSTRRKLGLHSFFGIALTRRSSSSSPHRASSIASERKASTSTLASESSRNVTSRRRSFRLGSRPATPRNGDAHPASKSSAHSIPVPSSPRPLSASPRRRSFGLNSPHNTPKSSAGHLPLPVPQGGQTHGRRHSVGAQQSPHDSAVALPEDQAKASKPQRPSLDFTFRPNKGKEKQQCGDWEQSRPNAHTALQSSAYPATLSSSSTYQGRRHLSSPTPGDAVAGLGVVRPHVQHLPTVESMSSDETEEPPPLVSPRPMHVIPKIIHTPPTPQRPGEPDSPLRPNTTPPRVDSSKIKTAHEKTKGILREQLLVSTSQCHADATTPTPSRSPLELTPGPPPTRVRLTPRLFRGKDLPKTKDPGPDKPGSRGGPPVGNVPPRHITSHRSKLGSFDFERPVSGLNRSNSTLNRSQTRLPLERTTSSDSANAGKARWIPSQPGHTDSPSQPQLIPNHTSDTSVVSLSSSILSKSTEKGTNSNLSPAQSSSWGRASGRRMQRTSHGLFAFEHPASLPSSPVPDPSSLPNSSALGSGQHEGPPTSSSSPWPPPSKLRPKYSRGQNQTPQEVDAGPPKQERKMKGKGRSLDLGLGLAWAPSHVREEAVMPGLFVARENIRTNSRSFGEDVTRAFEEILSAPDFEAFKKYVHRYDAHIISLDGPSGLLARVERLLVNAGLSEPERNSLLTEFAHFVENHA
ncbi:hypothetical protein ID866_3981 [Astraeus odoratus]|nr:hypothetical protein ID866_3981 [Astraeus odoratus]